MPFSGRAGDLQHAHTVACHSATDRSGLLDAYKHSNRKQISDYKKQVRREGGCEREWRLLLEG